MKKSLQATYAMVMGFFLLAPTSAIATSYPYEYPYEIVFAGTTTGSGTVSLYSPHYYQFDITSKYNQPRTVGTTPHRGTDLGSPCRKLAIAFIQQESFNGLLVTLLARRLNIEVR